MASRAKGETLQKAAPHHPRKNCGSQTVFPLSRPRDSSNDAAVRQADQACDRARQQRVPVTVGPDAFVKNLVKVWPEDAVKRFNFGNDILTPGRLAPRIGVCDSADEDFWRIFTHPADIAEGLLEGVLHPGVTGFVFVSRGCATAGNCRNQKNEGGPDRHGKISILYKANGPLKCLGHPFLSHILFTRRLICISSGMFAWAYP